MLVIVLWFGNSTENIDYNIGSTIFLPQLIDMSSGSDYTLFMDIDAIRIYLPLITMNSFEETIDDNYWTIGKMGSGATSEDYSYSNNDLCTGASLVNMPQRCASFVTNDRASNFSHSCIDDGISNNCDENNLLGIYSKDDFCSGMSSSYKIYGKYADLYTSSVGNINIAFTMP